MENTKAYVVTRSLGLSWGDYPVAVFFSKIDAEYYKWKKNNERSRAISWHSCYYSIHEVEVKSVNKDESDYKKFKKERTEEINKTIKEKEECSEKDEKAIVELKKEKENYI